MDFSELIRKARSGDPAALDEVYRRYSPAVIGRLRGQLRPSLRRRFDTEDLGQSVFAEVLRDLPNFESGAEGAFRKWLALKTRSKLFGKIRAHRTELTWRDEGVDDADPATGAARRDDEAKLGRALAGLDPEERTILALRGDGNSYAEIAAQVGLASADAARMRYTRAVLRLRERWPGA